jgi:hypothetical protein
MSHTGRSLMLQHSEQYITSSRNRRTASLNRTTSCVSRRNRSNASRMAVRRPMPGKVANWSTAWSSNAELSAIFVRVVGVRKDGPRGWNVHGDACFAHTPAVANPVPRPALAFSRRGHCLKRATVTLAPPARTFDT